MRGSKRKDSSRLAAATFENLIRQKVRMQSFPLVMMVMMSELMNEMIKVFFKDFFIFKFQKSVCKVALSLNIESIEVRFARVI